EHQHDTGGQDSRLPRRAVRRRQGREVLRPQGVPRPLVVHARGDRALHLRGAADLGHVPEPVVRAEHDAGALRGRLRAPPGRHGLRRLQLLAGAVLRGARRAAHAADPPLVGPALRRRDHRPHGPGVPDRGVPQAPRVQLGHRLGAGRAGPGRRLHRLLAPRRPALGQRPAHHPGRHPLDPGGRLLHLLLHVRRGVPRRGDHPEALHRPRDAHPRRADRPDRRPPRAAGAAQAHPVPRPGPQEHQRGRLPAVPRVHRQGRRVLLHRLRRGRAHRGVRDDQPDLELRALRPVPDLRRHPARLVHRLRRRRPAPDAGLDPAAGHGHRGHPHRVRDLRPHALAQRAPARAGPAGPDGG
ncbi:MAG: Ubiquinol-cytochrome C reductase, cytochrome B subunit, partial [uncultured Quadrisphaera sp.]